MPTLANESVYSSLSTDPDLCELVDMFVSEMPSRIENLIQQFDAGNKAELRRAAHQMKGAAGSYGFGPVSPIAGKLEASLIADRAEEEIRTDLDALVDICRRIRSGCKPE